MNEQFAQMTFLLNSLQLMKELREGLILAMTHRERFSKHIQTAFYDKESQLEKYTEILESYDVTVKNVLGVS